MACSHSNVQIASVQYGAISHTCGAISHSCYRTLLKGISLLDMNFDHSIINYVLEYNAGICYNNNKMIDIVD